MNIPLDTLSPGSMPVAPFLNQFSIPAVQASKKVSDPLPITVVTRKGGKSLFRVFMTCAASSRHPLQDGVHLTELPDGSLFLAISDAATRSLGVAPQDCTHAILSGLEELHRDGGYPQSILTRFFPTSVIRQLHNLLKRTVLDVRPGVIAGVAQTVCHVGNQGHVQLANIGDTVSLHFRVRKFLSPRLDVLAPTPVSVESSSIDDFYRTSPGSSNRLRSALGQDTGGGQHTSLSISLASARLSVGDLLLLGSDGGLPVNAVSEIELALRHFSKARKERRVVTLAQLAARLQEIAQEQGSYDDDRSLLLLEKLN